MRVGGRCLLVRLVYPLSCHVNQSNNFIRCLLIVRAIEEHGKSGKLATTAPKPKEKVCIPSSGPTRIHIVSHY